MKKILALTMAAAMVLSLAACGGNSDKGSGSPRGGGPPRPPSGDTHPPFSPLVY